MNDENSARLALTDPRTDAVTLAHIVQEHPGLGPLAAQHPQAYPELVQWIEQHAATAAAATAAPPQTAAVEQAASVPARRRPLLLVSLAAVPALLVGSAAITGSLALARTVTASSPSQDGSGSGDPEGGASDGGSGNDGTAGTPGGTGTSLPYTDTASGTADLVENASAGTGPVVLILDASGSMVRETSPGRTRMQDAQEAMTTAIGLLPDDAEVGMLVFGTGTGNDDSERAAGCEDVKTLQKITPLDRKDLSTAVAGVAASGFTPLGPSMRAAAGMLPADGPGTIVVVSDGVDTCSPPPACEVASELRSANPKLTIHAVGFAIDDDEQAQQQLECIGRVGGGGYVSAANVQQLGSRIARAGGTDTSDLLSDVGYRSIRLGMTAAEVEARVEGYRVTDEKTIDGVEHVYVDCSLGSLEFRSGALTAIAPKDESVTTLDGVAVGAKIQTASAVYGEPVDAGKDADGSYRVFRLSAGSPYGYRIYGDGTITRVVLCSCLPIDASGGYSSWEITFDAVGPIRLGMSVDDVRALLPGATDFIPIHEGEAATWKPSPEVPWLSVEIADGAVSKVSVQPQSGSEEDLSQGPALPHIRGIRVGDTMQTVYNYLPGGTQYDIRAAGIHTYAIATRTGRVVSFAPSWDGSGRVAAITLLDANHANAMFPATPALDLSAYPADLQGTWCQREDPDQCFSIQDVLREHPSAFMNDSEPYPHWYQPEARDYGFCLEHDGSNWNDCTTASTVFLTYYPAGVDGDCATIADNGWPACENDYPHDTSEPRLVIQANHQQGDLYWDTPPMYRK